MEGSEAIQIESKDNLKLVKILIFINHKNF